MGRAIYKNDRPNLVIKREGGKDISNCYSVVFFTVTSRQKLSKEKIEKLADAGFLGYGQEFYIRSKCDGNEEPAGTDKVQCVDENTGKQAMNPYSDPSMPYPDYEENYYEYKIERRIDSGD